VRFADPASLPGVFLLLVAGMTQLNAAPDGLPAKWRMPTVKELRGEMRKSDPKKFSIIRRDFDGDGKIDDARILVHPSTNEFCLFVKLSTTAKWEQLGETIELRWLDRIGIEVVEPGKHETACGKGYDESFCADGEPEHLNLSNPAIDLFSAESSDTYFYWDGSRKKFRQVQMSD